MLRTANPDLRSSVCLEDVDGAEFDHDEFAPSAGAKAFAVKDVARLSVQSCSGVPDSQGATAARPLTGFQAGHKSILGPPPRGQMDDQGHDEKRIRKIYGNSVWAIAIEAPAMPVKPRSSPR